MLDVANFNAKAKEAVQAAFNQLAQRRQSELDVEHLLYGLIEVPESGATELLRGLGVDVASLRNDVGRLIEANRGFRPGSVGLNQFFVTPRLENVLEQARNIRDNRFGDKLVSVNHLLIAIVEQADGGLLAVLSKHRISADAIYIADQQRRSESNAIEEEGEWDGGALAKYAINLSEMAAKGNLDPVIGRDFEIRRVVQTLMRRTKNNPVLIGDAGVGKTAIAEGLALHINETDASDPLHGRVVRSVDMGAMVAGSIFRGEFEERLKNLMDEAKASKGKEILFIDEIHKLVGGGTGGANPNDAGNMMKPALARGELQVVGATTPAEYRKYIESDSALERRFTPIWVEEPDADAAYEMLLALRVKYETHHGVRIDDAALRAAVNLSARYVSDRQLPDKAVDLMDEAMAKVRIASRGGSDDVPTGEESQTWEEPLHAVAMMSGNGFNEGQGLQTESLVPVSNDDRDSQLALTDDEMTAIVTEFDIADLISDRVGVPVSRLVEDEAQKILNLETLLHERVVGQDEALVRVSEAIRRARVGLKAAKRPIGVFLFMGPTGVGKTEVAKSLADALFNDEDHIIRIDMSELNERWSVSRLIGATPGYIGYDDGGQLTDEVRRRPFSVVLLDEIEKASPAVHDLMLQVFDDGRLTDGHGRTVDFSNTVVIMTSNVGATDSSAAGLGYGALDRGDTSERNKLTGKYERALNQNFRPEFINRIDDVVIFDPLTREQVGQILHNQLRELESQLGEHSIRLQITDAASEWMVDQGFDAKMGARPMQRAVIRHIASPLTNAILKGEVIDGSDVLIDLQGDSLSFVPDDRIDVIGDIASSRVA